MLQVQFFREGGLILSSEHIFITYTYNLYQQIAPALFLLPPQHTSPDKRSSEQMCWHNKRFFTNSTFVVAVLKANYILKTLKVSQGTGEA